MQLSPLYLVLLFQQQLILHTTANVASFVIKATFVNNAGTLSRLGIDLVYTPVSTIWTANITTSGTSIIVTVTGAVATNVGWVAQTNAMSITN